MKYSASLALLAATLIALPVSAQRLAVEETAGQADQVSLLGQVVEVKKYSFEIAVDEEVRVIKLAKGADLQLKLHKPVFQPRLGKLLVQIPGAGEPAERKEITLPDTVYVKVNFAHDNQRDRVMSTSPKRLNNYQLSPRPFSLTPQDSAIMGQLIFNKDYDLYRLKTADAKEHSIILGHQNASLRGFTIQDLKPVITRVQIKGVNTPDAIVASEVTFWPIARE